MGKLSKIYGCSWGIVFLSCVALTAQDIVTDTFLLNGEPTVGYQVMVDSYEQGDLETLFRRYCVADGVDVRFFRRANLWEAPDALRAATADSSDATIYTSFLRMGNRVETTFWFIQDTIVLGPSDSTADLRARHWVKGYLRELYLSQAREQLTKTEDTIRKKTIELRRLERGTEVREEMVAKYADTDRRRQKIIRKRHGEIEKLRAELEALEKEATEHQQRLQALLGAQQL